MCNLQFVSSFVILLFCEEMGVSQGTLVAVPDTCYNEKSYECNMFAVS
jgi:hypothetical protein